MVKLQPINRSNEKCLCFQKRYLSNIAKDQAVAGPARFLPPRWGIIGRIRYLLLQNAPLPAPRVQNSNKIKMRALCFAYNLVIYKSHGRGWLSFNSHCTEKDGMPANVNRNKSGTKNTTPRLSCQERIHRSILLFGKDWLPLIYHISRSDIVPSIFRFAKASYCTELSVLPIYLVSSR